MASRRTAYLLLLGMAVCFGGTWPAGKLAVEEVPPFTVAAVRFSIATALLALWAGARHGPIRTPGRAKLASVLLLGEELAVSLAICGTAIIAGLWLIQRRPRAEVR